VAGLAGRRRADQEACSPRARNSTIAAAAADAMGVLNDRERRIFEARRLADDPVTLEELSGSSASAASASARSRCAPSRRCRRP
jgi:hypothetical protein